MKLTYFFPLLGLRRSRVVCAKMASRCGLYVGSCEPQTVLTRLKNSFCQISDSLLLSDAPKKCARFLRYFHRNVFIRGFNVGHNHAEPERPPAHSDH
jgi:hypothetical protein